MAERRPGAMLGASVMRGHGNDIIRPRITRPGKKIDRIPGNEVKAAAVPKFHRKSTVSHPRLASGEKGAGEDWGQSFRTRSQRTNTLRRNPVLAAIHPWPCTPLADVGLSFHDVHARMNYPIVCLDRAWIEPQPIFGNGRLHTLQHSRGHRTKALHFFRDLAAVFHRAKV